MRTRAAILREAPGDYTVEEVELDDPKFGEVQVELAATGLCHSDEHIRKGETATAHFPTVNGHEGSGVVTKVGPGVTDVEVGDHIVTSFIPSCGKCKWCSRGMQNLCDLGAKILQGPQLDGTFRMHSDAGEDLGTMCLLGTFAEHQVFDQASIVKIDKDIPLDVACLVSCGVQTGFGSMTSQTAGNARPGDVVIVFGAGGIGMNAVQGAKIIGADHIFVVDPAPEKKAFAPEFGATRVCTSVDEAMPDIMELTNGQGADVAVLSPGLLTNEIIGQGLAAIRKAGTVVITAMSTDDEGGVVPGFNASNVALTGKRIQGALFGNQSPRDVLPTLLNMYKDGVLKLDELITKTYTLDQVNEGYADLRAGTNIRGVIKYT